MGVRMTGLSWAVCVAAAIGCLVGCTETPEQPASGSASFLYVWAGDKDKAESDFLAVVDVRRASQTYGEIVATLPVGAKGSQPHHVEYEFPKGGMLFADGWLAGQTSLIDLRDPLKPALAAQFKDMSGYNFPHSYARLDNGNVLVTLQGHDEAYGAPGGLAELAPDGRVIRTASARSADTPDDLVWPYSLAVVPAKDRAIVALSEMGMPGKDFDRTNQVQIWSTSDLKLLGTVSLPKSGVGEHHLDPAEPRVLADGTVYVNTFTCGLYRIDGVTSGTPSATFVHAFPGGKGMHDACAVPVVYGNYWIQTVPEINGLIALEVSDPQHPVEASRITFDRQFHMPHWVAADRTSGRLVVTGNDQSWALVVTIDQETGALAVDKTLLGGVNFNRTSWPHGETGPAVVHGAVFGP